MAYCQVIRSPSERMAPLTYVAARSVSPSCALN